MAETRSTCPYCGVGCGVIIDSDGPHITGVRGDPAHPANQGRLCSKGQTLHFTAAPHITAQVRALQPMRRSQRGAALQAVAWDAALDEVATRFAQTINAHGPDSIGLYLSGQLLTEDYYVFNKLGKGLIGSNNVDTNSRLCMSSAVAGYKASLGSDAVPGCYEDIEQAHTLFITGSNMAWAHPVLYRRLEAARQARPQMKVIVVDPRCTETAAEADLHLQIQPGTDVMLHHAMLHVMLWEGLADTAYIAAHTRGFEALRDRVRECTPAHAARICGVPEADIVTAARWFAGVQTEGARAQTTAQRTPTLSLWCQGLNQSSSGTDKNTTLINLHLATGQIGRAGAGPFSLTGQPNAMGGREVGGLANQLSAHRDLANAEHRAEVARLWGVHDVPATPGKAAVQMFEAAAEGSIKALWIVCTNPAQSLPDQALVRRALQRCEFVVVQEAYRTTATVAFADVLLPAASWGEKEGTVTNSERRITRVRTAVPAPGEARADWRIAVDVARRLERLLPERRVNPAATPTLFPYDSAEAVWNEHRESTRGRDLDITGLSYAALEVPQQWPCAEGQALQCAALAPADPTDQPAASSAPRRLYTDGHFATADGRARFLAPAWRPVAEARDARHPLALSTGRSRDQWHGMSRSGTVGRLLAHGGEPAIELHPQELQRRHWREGELVRVASRRGALVLPVHASEAVAPAQAFIAMHWGDEVLVGSSGRGGVNALTVAAVCPQSQQPELKHAAVRIERAELPWTLTAAAWLPAAWALRVQQQLRALLAQCDYASVLPFGDEASTPLPAQAQPGEQGGVQDEVQREPPVQLPAHMQMGLSLRVAAPAPVEAVILDQIEALLGLQVSAVLRYADARAGRRRAVALAGDGTIQAFLRCGGDDRASSWLREGLERRQNAAALGQQLLSDAAVAPGTSAAPPRAPIVCACHRVDAANIRQAARACLADQPGTAGLEATLAAVQGRLSCGTTCGSCLPAIKALLKEVMPGASPRAAADATADAALPAL